MGISKGILRTAGVLRAIGTCGLRAAPKSLLFLLYFSLELFHLEFACGSSKFGKCHILGGLGKGHWGCPFVIL